MKKWIILIVIGIVVLILALPVGVIKKVKAKVTIEGERISEYDIDKVEFTYANWMGHEANKLSITGDYTLIATICDPPSDCDSDSISFSYTSAKVRYSLYVPTFIGERDLKIELKLNGEVIDSIETTVDVE